jgi:hypothetical protein
LRYLPGTGEYRRPSAGWRRTVKGLIASVRGSGFRSVDRGSGLPVEAYRNGPLHVHVELAPALGVAEDPATGS